MRCPKCGCDESKVVDSRPSENNDAIRRRRECVNSVKRDIPVDRLNELIDSIESELRDTGIVEVEAQELGMMVLKRLVDLDKVAYVRFASVYRDFKDVDEFNEELRSLVNE